MAWIAFFVCWPGAPNHYKFLVFSKIGFILKKLKYFFYNLLGSTLA